MSIYIIEIYDEKDLIIKYPEVYSFFKTHMPPNFKFCSALSIDGDCFEVEFSSLRNENITAGGEYMITNPTSSYFDIFKE